MEVQSAWDTLVEASRYMFRGPSGREVLIFLFVLGITVAIITVPYLWTKISRLKEIRRAFFIRGRSLGLDGEEIRLLWEYARDFPYDPQMVYDNKHLFERVVTRIVHTDLGGVRLIPSIRAKLRFDTVPWFIPITNTRDLDLYQTGKLAVDGEFVDAAVWDKTETELHIVVLGALPSPIRVGDSVKFHFIRENEGRYTFESTVKDKYTEGDRLVLVLEHTEALHRLQLRESLRWKVSVPVEFALIEDAAKVSLDETSFIQGLIEDISTKGVRVCTEVGINPKEGGYILMRFSIEGHEFDNTLGEIVNVRRPGSRVCMGIKFLKISRQEERVIDRFILEEQRKLIKAYKVGKGE